MGIPAYFSHILSKHTEITKTLADLHAHRFHWLLMDCNSIIYDVVRENAGCTEHSIIVRLVIAKIREYIILFAPEHCTVVVFDGVAPRAKMEQQRERRFKNHLFADSTTTQDGHFSTVQITPGTPFMILLSETVKREFANDKNIVCSTADEPGEGEQKLFEMIRKTPTLRNFDIAVYGLDADLIMLSLFHLKFVHNIFVCREKPTERNKIEKKENRGLEKKQILCMNIYKLSRSLWPMPIEDYILVCFFLGNDFLPHFPSLNLRTQGLERILDAYHTVPRQLVRKCGRGYAIVWDQVWQLVNALADKEEEFLIQEMAFREKWETTEKHRLIQTNASLEEWKNSAPVLFRQTEHYIAPCTPAWRERYYQSLFPRDTPVDDIVNQYIQGLEWVLHYYTVGCPDTEWSYSYSYPPLLRDLAEGLKHYNRLRPINRRNKHYTTPQDQLKYVVPPPLYSIVGLTPSAEQLDRSTISLNWSFCRYLWEAHLHCENT